MVVFLYLFISCIQNDYDMRSMHNENTHGMFVPDCINTVSFTGETDHEYWIHGVEPEEILEQFVNSMTINAIHTNDHALHGFSFAGASGEGIIIRYHNVPRESSSLGQTFGYDGDSDIMLTSWTTYHGNYQSLATVYILFPIRNGLAYYNMRQLLGYDRWFEPGFLSWKADQYYYGLTTDLGEHLRECLDEYDEFLYGPTSPGMGAIP